MIWLDIAQIQVMFKFWVADQPIVMTKKKQTKKKLSITDFIERLASQHTNLSV